MTDGLSIMDDDGNEVELDAAEAACLLALTGGLESATVSACPHCRCRVLATVAFVDLLDASGPHPRSSELVAMADDAPTLHLYVIDADESCGHEGWHDPLAEEWLEAVEATGPTVLR